MGFPTFIPAGVNKMEAIGLFGLEVERMFLSISSGTMSFGIVTFGRSMLGVETVPLSTTRWTVSCRVESR